MPLDCLFCNMSTGVIEVPMVHEDDRIFAVRDISPRAPVHLLIVPREHIPTARDLTMEHGELLGHMMVTAGRLAQTEGVAEAGYRLTFNVGEAGGQTVYHLHLHLLGGRALGAEG